MYVSLVKPQDVKCMYPSSNPKMWNVCILSQTPRIEMYVSLVKPQDVKCMYP